MSQRTRRRRCLQRRVCLGQASKRVTLSQPPPSAYAMRREPHDSRSMRAATLRCAVVASRASQRADATAPRDVERAPLTRGTAPPLCRNAADKARAKRYTAKKVTKRARRLPRDVSSASRATPHRRIQRRARTQRQIQTSPNQPRKDASTRRNAAAATCCEASAPRRQRAARPGATRCCARAG